jgi:hypothetical protein
VGVKLGALVTAAAVAGLGTALAAPAAVVSASGCGAGANGQQGYAYAGHQATSIAYGVRATITPLEAASVSAGHVAAWVGVGGAGSGPGGVDEWLQAGVASLPGSPAVVYTEITRAGGAPRFIELGGNVQPGQSHDLAVLEIRGRPNWWRVWLDGAAATGPIHLPGSNGTWKPMATAESWNGGEHVCNSFAFRFDQIDVAAHPGGSWQTFVPGYRFLDRGYALRQLRPAPRNPRIVSTDALHEFAFEADSL